MKKTTDPQDLNPAELNYFSYQNIYLVLFYGASPLKSFHFTNTLKEVEKLLAKGHAGKIVVLHFKRLPQNNYKARVVFDSLFDFVADDFKNALARANSGDRQKFKNYFLRKDVIDYEKNN